jgi:hypothetical protein
VSEEIAVSFFRTDDGGKRLFRPNYTALHTADGSNLNNLTLSTPSAAARDQSQCEAITLISSKAKLSFIFNVTVPLHNEILCR